MRYACPMAATARQRTIHNRLRASFTHHTAAAAAHRQRCVPRASTYRLIRFQRYMPVSCVCRVQSRRLPRTTRRCAHRRLVHTRGRRGLRPGALRCCCLVVGGTKARCLLGGGHSWRCFLMPTRSTWPWLGGLPSQRGRLPISWLECETLQESSRIRLRGMHGDRLLHSSHLRCTCRCTSVCSPVRST